MIDKILLKASVLFLRDGFRSVSMDELAKSMSISKKTIYQHYKDKKTLVKAVTKKFLDDDRANFELVKETSTNALEEMIAISKHIRENFININPIVFSELKKYYPNSWKHFQRYREDVIIKEVEENLNRGMKEGLYLDDLDVKALAILRIEEVELAFNLELFPTNKFNALNVLVQFVEHFIRGIVTQKGFSILEKNKQSIKHSKQINK